MICHSMPVDVEERLQAGKGGNCENETNIIQDYNITLDSGTHDHGVGVKVDSESW